MTSRAVGVGLFEWGTQANSASFSVIPTAYSRSPWAGDTLHGGAINGLAAFGARRLMVDSAMVCCRLTTEILAPVLVSELVVVATMVKRGRRAAVVDVTVTQAGRTVVRASTQWVSQGQRLTTAPPDATDIPCFADKVADPASGSINYPRPGFNVDAVQVRVVRGSTEEPGPGVIWARLVVDLIKGEEVDELDRAATLSDLAAAAGWDIGPNGSVFINPDITLQLKQMPLGQWLAFDAANSIGPLGFGYNDATIYDQSGRIGRVIQSLVQSPSVLGAQKT